MADTERVYVILAPRLMAGSQIRLYSDTHPKMEAFQIQLGRQASPTRKMEMLAQLNAAVRILALAGLRSRYPQASEAERRRRLADLIL